jgi:ubiquinol-cytochrome c reductase core subunit 2
MQRLLRVQQKASRFSSAATSTVSYNRKGDQPSVAPPSTKTISKTKSGLNVATIDNQGPTSSLAIYIKAGSRFDSAEKPGVAHLLQRSIIRVRRIS